LIREVRGQDFNLHSGEDLLRYIDAERDDAAYAAARISQRLREEIEHTLLEGSLARLVDVEGDLFADERLAAGEDALEDSNQAGTFGQHRMGRLADDFT